jgi:membrane fusion protein (multidrug efflux system)
VYVVCEDDVEFQRKIEIRDEWEDIFVMRAGPAVKDKFVLEWLRQLRDGDRVEHKFHVLEALVAHLKHRAE